jgi:hypothetical protein
MRALISRRIATIALHGPATRLSEFAYRLRGWSAVPYRLAYYFVGSWLRRREPLPVQRVRLSGDAATDLARAAQTKKNVVIEAGAASAMPLVSALLMSNAVCDIDVEFGDVAAGGTGGELRLPGDFLSHHAFDHNVNRFLKTAHPGARILAVSLAEEADGFCDRAFTAWKGALAELAAAFPDAALVLLNPIGPGLARAEFIGRRGPAFSARLAGLSDAETLRLAQTADFFLGPLDAYGLVARAAGRPGVYIESAQSPQAAAQQLRLRMQS